MEVVKAKYDGQRIILPEGLKNEPGEVLVIFSDPEPSDRDAWLAAQEQVLSKVWDNPEDAEYDRL
jgi:hypothetical protein